MVTFVALIAVMVLGIMLLWAVYDCMSIQNKYCNSNYNRKNTYSELQLDTPEYEVVGVEQCSCRNMGKSIAKYKLWNFYIKKKDSVGHQELILYDEMGKYNIGDVLVFTLKQKEE